MRQPLFVFEYYRCGCSSCGKTINVVSTNILRFKYCALSVSFSVPTCAYFFWVSPLCLNSLTANTLDNWFIMIEFNLSNSHTP